ncbi:MAG TPA: Ig-like domain-containing protein [Gemmatimonadales bacterium]|nr:Ig-like domain-containing protein [Gemmatimonadales bacterium]
MDRIIPQDPRQELTVGRPDTVRVVYYDRRNKEVPPDRVRALFTSADTSVATVAASGAVIGHKAGSTRVRIQVGQKFGWVLLNVAEAPLPAPPPPVPANGFLKVPRPELHLTPGESDYVGAIFRRSDGLPGADVLITYVSDNPAVALVDSLTGRVTAMTAGTARLAVAAPGTTSIGATVLVGEPSLALSSDSLFLIEGTPDTLGLLVTSQRNRPYQGTVTWESGNANVAKVDSTGVIRGVTRGTTTITATTPYFTGQATVTVFPPGFPRSSLPPDTTIALPLGTTTELVIRGYSATDQQPLYLIPSVWTVGDTSVALYDRVNGQIVARAPGTTVLTGTPRIRSMNRPRVWKLIVFAGRLVPEVERVGLRVGMKQSVSGILLDTSGVRVNRPVPLRWDDPGVPGVQISGSGAVSVTAPGRYDLTGRAPWGAALGITVFGLHDLLYSEVEGKGSVIQGIMMAASQRLPQAVLRGTAVNMQPAVSPDRTAMVYASNRVSRDFDLWMADPDGGGEHVLVQAPGKDEQPVWFPSGSRIAFAAYRPGRPPQVYSVRRDGSGLTRVTDSLIAASSPTVAPDGSRIVYESLRGSQYDLFALRLSGDSVLPNTREQMVLASPDHERSPQFFPNGDLAYIREEAGGKRNRILMRLVAGSQLSQALTPPDLYVKDFAISPDGNWVVFSAPPPGERSTSSKYRLYLLDMRQVGVLTPTILYAPPSGSVGTPSFVP